MPNSNPKIVWLGMDFPASVRNMLFTLPIVLVTWIGCWRYPELHFPIGLMAGIWFAILHNVIWGWLVRRRSQLNKSGR